MTAITAELEATLDRLEKSEDKVFVSFVLNGTTHSLPTPMTVEQARVALATADSLGASRVSVRRFEN